MKKKYQWKMALLGVGACFLASAVACDYAMSASANTEVERGGTLRVIAMVSPRIIGWMSATPGWQDKLIAGTCIEHLVQCKDEAGAVKPWLAEKWEEKPDAKTVTLHLRKGVKFHDGSDFNGDVCKWNLEQFMASGRGELRSVESIDVIDDYTVRLTLSKWDCLILSVLSTHAGFMHSKKAYDTQGREWCEWNPVGTGPFKFVSAEKDVRIKYERFEGYWQKGKPYLDGVEWLIFTEPMTALAAFQRGEADALVDISPKDAAILEAQGKYDFTTVRLGRIALGPDGANTSSPFSNIKVRQAAEHAIDKKAICDALGYGYWVPINQEAHPGSWIYNPKVVGYPYNTAKAKQLLGEAGYANGFKTTIYCLSGSKDIYAAVQGYLKEVGIDATVELCTHARIMQLFTKGWSGLLGMELGWSMPDEYATLAIFFRRGMPLFRSVVKTDEFYDVIEESIQARDVASKRRMSQKMQKMMVDEDAMAIWIAATDKICVKNRKLHDDGLFTIGVMFWAPQDAWLRK